jgi:tRNA pseudouridine32 synthase/23S rRNA pseudouridine746 synthase
LTNTPFTPLIEQPALDGLPAKFTYPFYYQPHPLCLQAVQQFQQELASIPYFNQTDCEGKMLGVLLVQLKSGEIGYLSAFSGQMNIGNERFVPALFDINTKASFFYTGQAELNTINDTISTLRENPEIKVLERSLKKQQQLADMEIESYRQRVIYGRKGRKAKRTGSLDELSSAEYQDLLLDLSKQSVAQKNHLKALKEQWQLRLKASEQVLSGLIDEISALKHKRKQLSHQLQKRLFEQYHFLNAKGEQKSLLSLFEQAGRGMPAAGTGDCAAPKLLQYAYQHEMKPLSMAEFWWGKSPKSEIRHHGQFYGACQGKCKPILNHMIEGLVVEANPLLNNPGKDKQLEFVYQDEVMCVINKPAGLLSVPGKEINDSVYSRLAIRFPEATGPLIVHRLDMSTSGLMVIALNKQAHKKLQQQFIQRTVSKRYVAILDGELEQKEGVIDLPIRVDLEDRPRQLVCYDYGRPAQTKWKVAEYLEKQTRVYFYPVTGRTHQLRVHSAHVLGLAMPILGDDLYGKKSSRLHLHAETLELVHPKTKKGITFKVEPDF